MKGTCESCKYFDDLRKEFPSTWPIHDGKSVFQGWCRRHAPVSAEHVLYPQTYSDEWCGEYEVNHPKE